ncbi:hypothetical protein D9757_006326 [Collybiopsis confluens]|uniref:ATP-dependent DNA helicase n=1 Tax=Collybiopsis confluens TaxID=2823264 RepID=A0A8H5HGT3_9AGAR|nr:hypothetical protein D9757_006326 [Collybiopsis confluens]
MPSDDFFFDDVDAETLQQLNDIEARLENNPPRAQVANRAHSPIELESSDYGESFDMDAKTLEALDAIEKSQQVQPRMSTFPPSSTSSKGTLQTTLFGDVLPREAPGGRNQSNLQRSTSKYAQQEPRKVKQWDHTAFAKTGIKSTKKGKGKEKQHNDDVDEEEENLQIEPDFGRSWVQLDLLEAKHWIYPLNRPKRDYQFEIVKSSLFENTVVALPTGLGKTFVAGVIMLNYYRWFPEGKVVFVAPTKPLVAQQIEACHEFCGIPGSDAAELTGQTPREARNKYWSQKRVFYATPQTLINDLVSENCDPREIVLVVIDEAHRATGNYAYNQIIRYMMAKNPHFRVLALTATPGSNKEAVQNLIDGLHISRIEIRNEKELARYSHEKVLFFCLRISILAYSLNASENRAAYHSNDPRNQYYKGPYCETNGCEVRPLIFGLALTDLLQFHFKPIAHIWHGTPILTRIHPYSAQAQSNSLPTNLKYLFGRFQAVGSFARFLGYLMEGTIKMCYDELEQYSRGPPMTDGMTSAEKAAVTRAKKQTSDPLFLNIMNEFRTQNAQGFSIHPKMEKMRTLIIQHFGARMNEDGDPENGQGATKAMVFVTFRAAVEEIVEFLNTESPLIRATAFIGQGTDKRGKKGLAQREQLEVIKKFKENEYNVLVATSIGEEGLDIGEVDLAICYDTQKTPIRMLQRLGRTGRKRSGHVHILLADGREELNFEKAQSSYEDVQAFIIHGSHLEFYADVKRLLPDSIQPRCLEKEMETSPYVREDNRKKLASGGSPKKGIKRKRNDDIGRNMPQGASTTFITAGALIVKGKGKEAKKIKEPKNFDSLGTDDDDDRELAAGISGALQPPLKKSRSAKPRSTAKASAALRRSKTLDPKKSKKTGKGKEKENDVDPLEWTSSQLQAKGIDDSDDMDVESGMLTAVKRAIISPAAPLRMSHPVHTNPGKDEDIIDLTDSTEGDMFHQIYVEIATKFCVDFEQPFESPPKYWSQSPHQTITQKNDASDTSLSWLISDDEDNLEIDIVKSSPAAEQIPEPEYSIVELQDDDDNDSAVKKLLSDGITGDESMVEFVNSGLSPPPPSQIRNVAPLPPPTPRSIRRTNMPPPALPVRTSNPVLDSPRFPEPSFAVRSVGQRRGQLVLLPSTSFVDDSPVQVRRLHRRQDASDSGIPSFTPAQTKKRSGRSAIPAKHNYLFDYAAEHSGDEVSEGSSGSEDVESESDRLFLEELPETQASPSYDQSLVYRRSLMTQAPGEGPAFAHKPVRIGRFGRNSTSGNRQREGVSSSPLVNDEEPNEYEFGSFVVRDDAEISFE